MSVIEGQTLRFVLKEGRNRQIRRMCELVALRVMDLQRVRIGPLMLGDLPEGKWRRLTPAEREALIAASAKPRPAGPASGRASSGTTQSARAGISSRIQRVSRS